MKEGGGSYPQVIHRVIHRLSTELSTGRFFGLDMAFFWGYAVSERG